MKKIVLAVIFIYTCSLCFSWDQIATTYQTGLTPQDMVDIFHDEIKKINYHYISIEYNIHTNIGEQNYAWAVVIDENSRLYDYIDEYNPRYRNERSIMLYMRNGYVVVRTFDKSPQFISGELAINAYYDSRKKDVNQKLQDTINNYITESTKWLQRYKKEYHQDELEALEMLKKIKVYPGR